MESEKPTDTAFIGKEIRKAIHLSHQRSKAYNIWPHFRDPNQIKLSADKLKENQLTNRELLAVVANSIEGLFEQLFLSCQGDRAVSVPPGSL